MLEFHQLQERKDQVVAIGLDIAKSVFQVHGVHLGGTGVVRRQVRRAHLLPFFAKVRPHTIGHVS